MFEQKKQVAGIRPSTAINRSCRHSIRSAVFHRISAERTKLDMLEELAHELVPIGRDEDLHVDVESLCKLLDLLGMKI